MKDVDNIPTFALRYSGQAEKGYVKYAERKQCVERTLEGRLHRYLRELRKGIAHNHEPRNERSSMFTKRTAKDAGDPRQNVEDKQGERYTVDHWKRMMRLHGTVKDSKFTEEAADRWKEENDLVFGETSNMHQYATGSDDAFLSDDIYDQESSTSEDGYRMKHNNNSQFTEENMPVTRTDGMEYVDISDEISMPSFQEYSEHDVSVRGNRKVSDVTDTTTPSTRITKHKSREHEQGTMLDGESLCEELDVPGSGATGDEEPTGEDYQDQVKLLRRVADQIEMMATSRVPRNNGHNEKCRTLSNQLQSQNEELVELRNKVSKYEDVKREMEGRIKELETQLRRSTARGGVGDVLLADGMKEVHEVEDEVDGGAETLPPMILETNDVDARTRAYVKTLKSNLYASLEQSLTISFQTDLYQSLHELPEVVHCKDIVHHINDCIIGDSEVLHTRLRQCALRQGMIRIFVEAHLSPFTNRYPFPPEFEQRIVADMEATHPLRRFSMAPSKTRDMQREKMGIVMNRLVLRTIFKYSHINNLYNYLFTALYWDNFRVVDILKDAIGAKFLDFQMVPKYKKRFRHPVMWAFGDSCNSTQAYRYMKALDFNFAQFPSDPNDGENLWHRVVKGDAVRVAQSLKAYMMYTDFLSQNDQKGHNPLEISRGRVRKELLTLVVVDVATKGSDLYKKNDFEAALSYYSRAIEKQIEAISIDADDRDEARDVNLGKLYYNKARSLIHLNRWTETVDACERCIEHIPSYTNAYVTCIQAYEKLLDWENAVKMCCLMGENCGVVDDEKMATLQSQLGATMFQILGLPNTASPREIRQAFNQLCKQWHPDKIGLETMKSDIKRRSMNQFNRIYDAREKLLDANTRILEQKRPETHYRAPEPITESGRKQSEDNARGSSSGIEPLTNHLSKLRSSSQNDSTVEDHLLQTVVDRLQQQIDEMQSTG